MACENFWQKPENAFFGINIYGIFNLYCQIRISTCMVAI